MSIKFPEKYKGEPALLEYSKVVDVYKIIREAGEAIAILTIPEQAALLRTLANPEKEPEVFGKAGEVFATILLGIISEKVLEDMSSNESRLHKTLA